MLIFSILLQTVQESNELMKKHFGGKKHLVNGVFIEACFRSVFRHINDVEKRPAIYFPGTGSTLCCKRLIWDNLAPGCGITKRN